MSSPKGSATSSHPRVFLGMSGGVDSSVSAILLLEQGYDVTGVYMKNWAEDLPGMQCPWAADLADAKRVAVRLGIDFEVWDFQAEYKKEVVDYMLAEFERGRTPNPDVICNERVKFKLFYERAMARGADYIATGHYAQVHQGEHPQLLRSVDENKDQTYFLYRMSDEALSHTLFPVGAMTKPEVKALAKKHQLDVAGKKESMGICFVGEVGMKDFLSQYLETSPGEIRERETDQVLGYHDGAIFYTLGQRHGLYLGGGLPYYVVAKDLKRNIVYVSRNLNSPDLWTEQITLTDLHLRGNLRMDDERGSADSPEQTCPSGPSSRASGTACSLVSSAPCSEEPATAPLISHPLEPATAPLVTHPKELTLTSSISCSEESAASAPITVRLRHRGELIKVKDLSIEDVKIAGKNTPICRLSFSAPIRRPAPGQSAVLYSGKVCLGGGIVSD